MPVRARLPRDQAAALHLLDAAASGATYVMLSVATQKSKGLVEPWTVET
jgi:hypothetical protein